MMYFSRLKKIVILGLCLLGALLCIPNLLPAPAPWLPWRTVHLGLDLRGGSYLLMRGRHERGDQGAAGRPGRRASRQALRPRAIFYQTLEAQPDQNRVLLRLRDPDQDQRQRVAALKPLIAPEGPTSTPGPRHRRHARRARSR